MRVLLSAILICTVSTVFAQHQGHGAATGYADSVNAGLIAQDTMKKSPHRVTMADIGDAHVHIEYGSPGVRGRTIWGGLVAYDQVWSAGAHKATKISFSKPVQIAGKKIEAGSYGFFLVPGKEKFIVILNRKWDQHLADEYDPKDDVLRTEIVPQMPDKTVQRLTYEIVPNGRQKAELRFSWEKVLLRVPVEF